jgi:hypothetical protein
MKRRLKGDLSVEFPEGVLCGVLVAVDDALLESQEAAGRLAEGRRLSLPNTVSA